jgi:hypothetical protein
MKRAADVSGLPRKTNENLPIFFSPVQNPLLFQILFIILRLTLIKFEDTPFKKMYDGRE